MRTQYGWVEIGNVRYHHDVIIHANQSVRKRSKKKARRFREWYGHTPLTEDEIAFLKSENPDIVYIGTGQYDALPITLRALRFLSDYPTIIRTTPEIVEMLARESRPFVAVLHVSG